MQFKIVALISGQLRKKKCPLYYILSKIFFMVSLNQNDKKPHPLSRTHSPSERNFQFSLGAFKISFRGRHFMQRRNFEDESVRDLGSFANYTPNTGSCYYPSTSIFTHFFLILLFDTFVLVKNFHFQQSEKDYSNQ